jgi:hypothetical protein
MPSDRVREILPSDTAATWDAIAPVLPPDAYLGGGTAIAVHLGHRVSRDLDFFFHHDSIDLDKLARRLNAVGPFAVTERSAGTLNGIFSATKVQFLHADEARPQHVLEPPEEVDGLQIAGLSDLLAMKLKVVGDRGELRDYFDLMTIEQRTGRTADEGLALFVARFEPEYPQQAINHILLGLGYFDDVDRDDALPVSRDEIVDYWTRRQPEIIAARGRLRLASGTRLPRERRDDLVDGGKAQHRRSDIGRQHTRHQRPDAGVGVAHVSEGARDLAGSPVHGAQLVRSQLRPRLLGARVVDLCPDLGDLRDLAPAHEDGVRRWAVQERALLGEGVQPDPALRFTPPPERAAEPGADDERGGRKQRHQAGDPDGGAGDQDGDRRHREQAHRVGTAPDASARLAAEDPGDLAGLEPDGQLLGVGQLRGVPLGLPVDAPLKACPQLLLSLRPDRHRNLPGAQNSASPR